MAQVDHSQTTNSGLSYVIGCWHGQKVSKFEKQNALATSCGGTLTGLTKQDYAALRVLSGQTSQDIRYSIPRPFATASVTVRPRLDTHERAYANPSRSDVEAKATASADAKPQTAFTSSHVVAGNKKLSTSEFGDLMNADVSAPIDPTAETSKAIAEDGIEGLTDVNDLTDFGGFPGDAEVPLATCGRQMRMDELSIGDAINTTHVRRGRSGGAPSARSGVGEIIFFSHAHHATSVQHTGSYLYLTLRTSTRHSVTLGPSQYLPLNGKLAAAHTAALGDVVTLGDGRAAIVTNIIPTRRRSRYAPHVGARHGLLIVDGVAVAGFAADGSRPALGVIETAYRACSARACRRALGSAVARRSWAALAALYPSGSDFLPLEE